ncbi:hypothetical protein [Chryseobacterium sp.]|uniref:hypothetical protein n=1 Tax=Chryseobacterium sp. TaxID=1871047 RepID=UPI00289EF363|nr:hypothetical protein [Chryseobacterium sp.]
MYFLIQANVYLDPDHYKIFDALEELNKLCKNGHEVATEISDCCTSIYLHFSLDHVVIKEIL